MIGETGAKRVVNNNNIVNDTVIDQCSSAVDNVQRWSNSAVDTVSDGLKQILEFLSSNLESVSSLGEKVGNVFVELGDKVHDLTIVLRENPVYVKCSGVFDNVKFFVRHGISSQAMYFGLFGLATGSLIGLCIGYAVRRGSSQIFSTSASSNLMRAILTTSTRRRVDGVTVGTTVTPTLEDPFHVLVQVKAMSVDSVDVKLASGFKNKYRLSLGLPPVYEPYILGRECSGIIVDVGHNVSSLEVNDRVWICIPIWAARGVMAEYVSVPEKYVGLKPKNVSFEAAATIPYAALTLWRKVLIPANLNATNAKNKRVLIHFGSITKNDGVGLLATQILRLWGARVTVSVVEQSEDHFPTGSGVAQLTFLHTLKSLGAECHLMLPNDITLLPNVAQRIFDVVINTDAAEMTALLEYFCKDPVKETVHETFVPDVGSNSSNLFESVFGLFFPKELPDDGHSSHILDECRRMIESNYVAPVVARSFIATQYDQAFRHVMNDSNSALAHVGKNVIVFRQSGV